MQKAQEALKQFADALAKQDAQAQNQALQKLAEQMQKGQMTPEEMKALSQQLQQMAQALKNTPLDQVAKQLQQAAQQMRTIKLDPETLKKLAQMVQKAGGT
jgi:polyhydroxyalkanoate synthesis regulator phasin